jgi:NitT/TauT family transport system substrate-binding protein
MTHHTGSLTNTLRTLTLIVALTATLFAQSSHAQEKKAVVRIGYVPVLIYAPLYLAQEKGYFAKEGIDAQLTPVQGGSDSVVQLAAGNFDAAVGGIGAGLLNAANKGLDFKIVAPMHAERKPLSTSLVISAKRAEEFKSVKDLKGKTISINATGAATEYWLAEALRLNGLTYADVKITQVGFANVPAALENKSIDAAMLGDPITTQQVEKGVVKILADDFIDGFYATYLYMGSPLLKDRPAVAEGFMRAYLQATRDLQDPNIFKDKDFAAIIEKYTKVPADTVTQASRPYYEPNGVIPVANINTLQDYFLTRGVLEYKTPVDMTKFIDQSLAEKAIAKLGKFTPKAAATMAATPAATPAK